RGFATQPVIPDVGIMASYDIVALEKATLDLIDKQKYIEGTLPGHLRFVKEKGHLFERIWGKDPYIQVKEAAKLKLGNLSYNLKEID
ncbi:MAG: 4Fe-4S ferredoxin, partial [Candidatus Omnitrophica bacterium]|nr:4Fe-4S ferredoxin [Candidatus Omnitrophota bacterium]